MSLNIYCSLSHDAKGAFDDFRKRFEKYTYYQVSLTRNNPEGSYNNTYVKNCDALVVMHPLNKFEFEYKALPSSIKADVEWARKLGKRIFLLYRTKAGELLCYSTFLVETLISGNPGSSGSIFRFIEDNCKSLEEIHTHNSSVTLNTPPSPKQYYVQDKEGKWSVETPSSKPDRRLLLTIK